MDNASHILQFEYMDISGQPVFLKVHSTFEHYYTGETMRFVQWDFIRNDGSADSEFGVVNEDVFRAFYDARVEDES